MIIRYIQQRMCFKMVEHLAEQLGAATMRDRENIRMKQEYDEDVKHQVEESEMRDREMQRKLLEQKEKEEEEKRQREEEIKKVIFLRSLSSLLNWRCRQNERYDCRILDLYAMTPRDVVYDSTFFGFETKLVFHTSLHNYR